jgi:hypothetical protein
MGFLVRRYSLAKVKALYQGANKLNIWIDVFGAAIPELENQWLASLTPR